MPFQFVCGRPLKVHKRENVLAPILILYFFIDSYA